MLCYSPPWRAMLFPSRVTVEHITSTKKMDEGRKNADILGNLLPLDNFQPATTPGYASCYCPSIHLKKFKNLFRYTSGLQEHPETANIAAA